MTAINWPGHYKKIMPAEQPIRALYHCSHIINIFALLPSVSFSRVNICGKKVLHDLIVTLPSQEEDSNTLAAWVMSIVGEHRGGESQ